MRATVTRHNPYEPAPTTDCGGPPHPPRLPGWARAADFTALALAVGALTVGVSGGFRLRAGSWRFAFTSPYRLLFWAAAISLARYALARDEPMFRHLLARVTGWVRSASFSTAFTVAVATRPIVFLAGYLAVFVFGYASGAQPFHEFNTELQSLPLRWDAGWYLKIARDGYEFAAAAGSEQQQNIVFFPAYPLIVRVIALMFGNTIGAYVLGGMAASLVLFVLALAYCYRLALEHLTEEQATTAVWLLAVYPFALFYGAIYTESLFLLGTLGAFYHFRKGEPAKAGAWGLLVGLTRPNGFLLCVPLALVAFEPRRRSGQRFTLAQAFAAAMPIAGALVYSAYVWRLTGNPIQWAMGHAAWGRHYEGVTHLVANRFRYISSVGLPAYVGQEPYDFLNGLGVLFVLAAVWPVARRFSAAYAVFILLNILPPLSTGLMSTGRFSAVLFPAFLWLASAVPPRHRAGWIAAFAAMQAFNAALFYTWRPLY